MKRKSLWKVLLLAAMGLMLAACATTTKPVSTFNALDLNPLLQSGEYVLKANNFSVIVDKSGSMGEMYKGQQKLGYAKELVCGLNQTIPDINATGALRAFGRFKVFSNQFTKLMWGPAAYAKAGLRGGLGNVGFSVGESPLNIALDAAARDFASAQGNIAVIIFTDGNKEVMNYDAVKKSAMNLKSQFGDRICIYTVQIGDGKEAAGFLAQVAADGGCGFSVNGDAIASSQGMADFATKVFLAKAPPPPEEVEEVVVILDSDGDGVPDNLDKCPGTPRGARVNKFGCWVLGDVLFDFDKYNIKPQYYGFLDEAARVFEMNPGLKVQLQGNTDNIGTQQYNMRLSIQRAKSVMRYLLNKGVAENRLSVRGFGYSRPVASNATEEGRALNRRVELTPTMR